MRNRRSATTRRLACVAVFIGAVAGAQYALDGALDANPRVGSTGYNPRGASSRAGLASSDPYRLNRRTGDFVYAAGQSGGNRAFLRPEYSAQGRNRYGSAPGVAAADEYLPSGRNRVLKQQDAQQRLTGFAYNPSASPNRAHGGLATPAYSTTRSRAAVDPAIANRFDPVNNPAGVPTQPFLAAEGMDSRQRAADSRLGVPKYSPVPQQDFSAYTTQP